MYNTDDHKDMIPFPEYESWMHKRYNLQHETLEEKKERWKHLNYWERLFDSLISHFIATFQLYRPGIRHVMFKVVRLFFRIQFKIFNRFKVYGRENIPEEGAIFYVNHPGQYDPILLMSAVPFEVGAFLAWNRSWFMEMIGKYYGMISKVRNESRRELVERMVRQLLTGNRYFSIWPEGHPNYTGMVEQGFSSIVRVYATLNYDKDRIPFVPVLIRGGGVYIPGFHYGPIDLHFLESFYLPRKWLKKPEDGGKTPREIIDWMMLKLARAQKQPTFIKNRLLEAKRLSYRLKDKPYRHHMVHHLHHLRHIIEWGWARKVNNIRNIIMPNPENEEFNQKVEKETLDQYLEMKKQYENISGAAKDPIITPKGFHGVYRQFMNFKCTSEDVDCEKIIKEQKRASGIGRSHPPMISKSASRLRFKSHVFVMEGEDAYDVFLCSCKCCGSSRVFIFNTKKYYSG